MTLKQCVICHEHKVVDNAPRSIGCCETFVCDGCKPNVFFKCPVCDREAINAERNRRAFQARARTSFNNNPALVARLDRVADNIRNMGDNIAGVNMLTLIELIAGYSNFWSPSCWSQMTILYRALSGLGHEPEARMRAIQFATDAVRMFELGESSALAD